MEPSPSGTGTAVEQTTADDSRSGEMQVDTIPEIVDLTSGTLAIPEPVRPEGAALPTVQALMNEAHAMTANGLGTRISWREFDQFT